MDFVEMEMRNKMIQEKLQELRSGFETAFIVNLKKIIETRVCLKTKSCTIL